MSARGVVAEVLCHGFSQPCVQGGGQVRLLREHGLSSLVTLLLHPRVPVQVVGGRIHAAPLPTTFLATLKDQEATVAVGAASASARRHLTRVEDQLRCIGTLGKALWALVVSRWRQATEKSCGSLRSSAEGHLRRPVRNNSTAWRQAVASRRSNKAVDTNNSCIAWVRPSIKPLVCPALRRPPDLR